MQSPHTQEGEHMKGFVGTEPNVGKVVALLLVEN